MKMKCEFCEKKITLLTYNSIMLDGIEYDCCWRCKKEKRRENPYVPAMPIVKKVETKPLMLHSEDNEFNFKSLVQAQNRTTYAVRAFVRFLFIQLTGTTFAIVLWNLSTAFIDQQRCIEDGTKCTGDTFLQTLAGVVFIGTIIWSSNAGWKELNKSNID